MKGKLLKIIVLFILILLVIYLAIGNYFFNYAFVRGNNDINTGLIIENINNKEVEEDWFYNESRYKDEYITSDRLKLHAYSIENYDSKTWVILAHGYNSSADQMISTAKKFYDMGCNVLIPDLRAHGKSEGKYIGMGWLDRKDMLRWIDLVIEKDPTSEIILYGISLGATTVMMTAGENLESNVKLIIEDSGYTSAWDEFSYHLNDKFKIPASIIMIPTAISAAVRANYLLTSSAVSQLKNNKLPILFIHGSSDHFAPITMLDELYDATKSFKEKLIIEDASHAMPSVVDPVGYWDRIEEFINRYM